MEAGLKSRLKAIALELRRELEGFHDAGGAWHPGDLERRLGEIGVWRDRPPKPADELAYRTPEDLDARRVVDAYVKSHVEAGLDRERAIEELVREAAYTWANRLLALRCMEARGLIDDVILQKDSYGGRSLQHHRLAKRAPERCAGEDEGLFAVLSDEFERRAVELPLLFDPRAPEVALRPSVRAINRCVALLSGREAPKGQHPVTDEVFTAPDAAGWAYQYWNTEEKDRVFASARPPKRAKIAGADIIPATCIYTEPYMVKFLVQNSLGALWMGMHAASRLCETWNYYVRDADRAPVSRKPVREIAFLDPACGSGHFLIEAFDLFFEMYREEGELTEPAAICGAILEHNLFGIDIDERAVQIAAFALVMKAKERAPDFVPRRMNLVATNIRLPATKEHLDAFLRKHPEDAQLKPALVAIFDALAHADEFGSLLQIEEPVEKALRTLKAKYEAAGSPAEQKALWAEYQKPVQGKLPIGVASYDEWKERVLGRIREHFDADARSNDLGAAFFGEAGAKGVSLVDLLDRRYDVVAANPPYLGTKKQNGLLKGFLKTHYPAGQYDLYAAFLVRGRQLLKVGGIFAAVTRSTWLYQKWYVALRERSIDSRCLREIALLGTGAFSDFGGDVVDVHLQVITETRNDNLAISSLAHESNKDVALRGACGIGFAKKPFPLFEALPGKIISADASPALASLFTEFDALSSQAKVTDSVVVVSRFLRFWWEVPHDAARWLNYSKGGAFSKWRGLEHYALDWQHDGARLKTYVLGRYPPSKFRLIVKEEGVIGKPGLTWTTHAAGAFGVRLLSSKAIVSSKGPGIFVDDAHLHTAIALLNSRVATYLLRIISPGQEFGYKYVERLPIPDLSAAPSELESLGTFCVKAKGDLIATDLRERRCDIALYRHDPTTGVGEWIRGIQDRDLKLSVCLLAAEGAIERYASEAYRLPPSFESLVYQGTGLASGRLPRAGDDVVVPEIDGIALPESITRSMDGIESVSSELEPIEEHVRQLFEAGPGAASEDEEVAEAEPSEENDDADDGAAAFRPVPAETFLETMSVRLGIHPVSVFGIVRKGREKEGWSCLREEQRLAQDMMSAVTLRLLGHLWPRQVESIEPVPDWADRDGIIPITEGTAEPTLLVRVRERIAADFGVARVSAVEREFEEITGKPLATWLGSDFFKRHISQFRKRPIAWQLRSTPAGNERRRGRGAVRSAAAFSCLVYYHRLDGDLVPKLRSQYIGPLRARLQTELTGLERIKERTRDQDARRVELEAKIEELRAFDARLEEVIVSGFSGGDLETLIAKESLDKWTSRDGRTSPPTSREALLSQERRYDPDLNDGVRINVAPLQRAGLLAADVLAAKDVEKAIADRAEWRADERRWCREGKLPQPGWWPAVAKALELPAMPDALPAFEPAHEAALFVWALLHASGGPVARMDVARAFALRSQPAVLRRFAPPELRAAAQGWADRVGQRTIPAGLLATALSDLAGRDGIRLTTDRRSQSIVTTGDHTPSADKVDAWFRFEAKLALGVLSALPSQHLQELDAGISGEDRKLLAAGAA